MQKKTLTCFLIICFCFLKISLVTAQNFQWAYATGSMQSEDEGQAIAVDDSGNVYTASRLFYGMVIFKNDAMGNLVWFDTFPTIFSFGFDGAPSVTIDNDANLYLTGSFENTVDFDPGLSVFNLTTAGNSAYILKLNRDGNFVWAKMIDAYSGSTSGNEIQYSSNGFIILTGNCHGQIDFDPGPGISNSTNSNGGTDAFVLMLDTAGNFVWGSIIDGTGYCMPFGLKMDAANNVILSGRFVDTVDFDPGPAVFTISASPNATAFILKLDATGNFVWAHCIGDGLSQVNCYSVDVDPSGNVYASGVFTDSCDFDPGAGVFMGMSNIYADCFVLKLDENGIFEWASTFGGPDHDYAHAITYSNQDALIVTGKYAGIADLNPGPGIFNLGSNGNENAFILSLDLNGSFINAKSIGGSGSEFGFDVITDSINNIYLTGYFEGTVDFNPPFQYNLVSNGGRDVFTMKFGLLNVGVEELNANSDFNVYPNPGNGNFTFEFDDFYSGEYVISNLLGEQIETGAFENSRMLKCDIDDTAGIYFVIINTGDKILNSKLIKN